jgi:hypothetical protein
LNSGVICILATLALWLSGLNADTYGVVATGPGGSNAQAVHTLGYTGAGVNVGLISFSNTLVTHEAFYDKDVNGFPIGISHAFWNDATDDGQGYDTGSIGHDTWIAGVIASRGGAAHPTDIGVAPGVDIYSERVVRKTDGVVNTAFIENALDDLVSHNCHVVFTGIAFPDSTTPDGSSIWSRIYDYYADTYNIVFANPAGNYDSSLNPTNHITVFGDAYNGITTAGLIGDISTDWRRIGSVSSLGPTADDRKKPDVAAPSQNQTLPTFDSNTAWLTWTSSGGQTSFSAPQTAGVAALLLEYANATADTSDNQNEVIRAVIVNSTFPNIRDNNNVPTTGELYNVARGYGRLDALRAYQTLAASKIIPDGPTAAAKGWAYDSVRRPTSPDNYYVTAAQNQRLLVTLVWNRTFSSKYTQDPLANLNLTVIDPNGTFTRFSDTAAKDNLKKCDILLPHTGEYKITIAPSSTLSSAQNYGLAFEIIPPITGDFDLNYVVDYNDLSTFAAQWLLGGTADFTAPSGVDFADFAVFAQNWLSANNAYYAGY